MAFKGLRTSVKEKMKIFSGFVGGNQKKLFKKRN